MLNDVKIALVYDWIDKWGGVERLLLTLHEMFPQAEFYTSYNDLKKASWAKDLKIKSSFIQRFPKLIRNNRIISFPFYPYAFESFDFSDYDLVISVTSSFAKSIITKPGTLHVSYMLSPTRYLWLYPNLYLRNKLANFMLSDYLAKLREWDFIAAHRPDHIISISQTVAERCKKFYQRNSEVIYPPFDIDHWKKIKKSVISTKSGSLLDSGRARFSLAKMTTRTKKYFLVVSRLEPYKKIELVLQSINKLKQNLIIVGEGSQLEKLKKIAGENVTFLNQLTDQELGYFYLNAEALIMPQEEDFGYVSLEAQFFGCPVIAYRKGGASETIVEGKTGMFFEEQSVESLMGALRRYNMVKYELKRNIHKFGLQNTEKFSKNRFTQDLEAFLISKIKD